MRTIAKCLPEQVMPDQRTPFSRRHGFVADATPITVREDATEDLRFAVAQLAVEVGLSPSQMRNILCRVLLTQPNQDNWSEYPNIWDEVQSLLADCPWHKVYDIAEAVHNVLATNNPEAGQTYESSLNDFVRERGIGWEMRDGEFLARGSEGFSAATSEAAQTLADEGRDTAARELHEALHDLSRRPEPDITGSIQHAMAAVECVARDVAGTPNLTLGDVINRHAATLDIRPPLDQALHKLWSYASEQGRHLREGQNPEFEEAELVVGIAAAVCTFLSKKASNGNA